MRLTGRTWSADDVIRITYNVIGQLLYLICISFTSALVFAVIVMTDKLEFGVDELKVKVGYLVL